MGPRFKVHIFILDVEPLQNRVSITLYNVMLTLFINYS
jgi:hypothetical protein